MKKELSRYWLVNLTLLDDIMTTVFDHYCLVKFDHVAIDKLSKGSLVNSTSQLLDSPHVTFGWTHYLGQQN